MLLCDRPMLNVECEACGAPYQIDERRVPLAGLKMRCPKCGHSFIVTNPDGISGAPARIQPARPQLPSDFPAALGSLDEPDLPVVAADLPAAKGKDNDLPSPKRPPPPRPPPKTSPAATVPKPASASAVGPDAFTDIGLDLPEVRADLPEARRGLPKPPPPPRSPPVALAPPATASNLPASKPVRHVDLPSLAAQLPSIAALLPRATGEISSNAQPSGLASPFFPAPTMGFGELDLLQEVDAPAGGDPLDHHSPPLSQPSAAAGLESFGEIDLPREPPVGGSMLSFSAGGMPSPSPSSQPSAGFGDLELDDRPPSRERRSASAAVFHDASHDGGMTFGEVDLSSTLDGGSEGSAIGIADTIPRPDAHETSSAVSVQPSGAIETSGPSRGLPVGQAAISAQIRSGGRRAAREGSVGPSPKRSMKGRFALGLLAAGVLAGAALQLTPFGAYGYLLVSDRLHASDYEQAASATVGATEKALGADTYDDAKAAVEAVVAAHARRPRARSLTAYAALVDAATTVRFGQDNSRASRAQQLLTELPPGEPVKYRSIALAALAAANDEFDKARTDIEQAAKSDPGDPIQIEVSLLGGYVALTNHDGAAALVEFKRALALSNDARVHFGLARAYDMVGDVSNAGKEIGSVLVASPQHPGALTLRARMNSSPTTEAQVLADLATVIDGPARAKAAPNELSKAYAAKGWIHLERGRASEARDAFAQAVKLDPRNVGALSGEGRLLLSEGRYTEALARFDTEVQVDPGSPGAIADDAEAKLALDRPAEAKQQLADARLRFPKSLPILLSLGRVEQHLGNSDAAEADMRAAIAMVEPSRRDAVLPYVALSELLSSRGKLAEAKLVLDEAKTKLSSSAALDRALGEVAELQGEHDIAIAQYRAAIARDPRDVAAHFRLAVTLRRIRRFDDAGAELDKVVAIGQDYPGLALERGLLFEESGEVQKAIDQFKAALSRAPDDPDLQLRVGSAYVTIGRPDDAIPMLRKVLLERPTSAEAHHYLGRALMLKGPSQQADALRYLRRAVDLDPNRAEFHVYLGWAANEAVPPQVDLAGAEIDKALALDKLDADAYWQKGVLERMQGAITDAIKDENRALELRPSRYEAHATLAECYEDRNEEAPAMAEWAKAVAGDGDTPAPEGGVRHPYWRYKYGKLLVEHGNTSAALPLMLPAATSMEKSEQRPWWLGPLEFLTARSLDKSGHKTEAIEHYQRFLDIAPVSSPDRDDAESALRRLKGTR